MDSNPAAVFGTAGCLSMCSLQSAILATAMISRSSGVRLRNISIAAVVVQCCFSNWFRGPGLPQRGDRVFQETKMCNGGRVSLAVLNLYVRITLCVATFGNNHYVSDSTLTVNRCCSPEASRICSHLTPVYFTTVSPTPQFAAAVVFVTIRCSQFTLTPVLSLYHIQPFHILT